MELLQLAEEAIQIAPDTTVRDTMSAMVGRNATMAAVVDGGRLVGLVTEHHLKRRATELGPTIETQPVRDTMLGPVHTVQASTPVLEAANIMRAGQLRTLGLVDDRGGYLGMVTLRRVLYEVMDELDLKVDNLERELMADGPGG